MREEIIKIIKLGPKGDGIADTEKGRVYVDRTAPGDVLQAKITKELDEVFRGEVIRYLELSELRTNAPCPHFEKCGSCSLQHINENYYREWKQETLKESLKKYFVKYEEWIPPVFLEGGQRRRLTFSITRLGNKITVGYYKRRSDEIIDIDSCLVSEPEVFGIREKIKHLLPSIIKSGDTVDIFFQKVGDQIDMAITGPIQNSKRLEELLVLTSIARISHRMNYKQELRMSFEKETIEAKFGELKVELPPAAFLQPTVLGEKALVEAILKALPENGTFADLFSGCGTFTGHMLSKGSVDAFESDPEAVKALTKASKNKKLKAFKRDLYKNPLSATELNKYDAIVFDPPRAGAEEQCKQLAKSKVETIIGVSCNVGSFSRDASLLVKSGYKLRSIQIIDQFQWSHHMELVGVFRR